MQLGVMKTLPRFCNQAVFVTRLFIIYRTLLGEKNAKGGNKLQKAKR